jgi:hypothetical protein
LAVPYDEEGIGDHSSRIAALNPIEYLVNKSSTGAVSDFPDALMSEDHGLADGNVVMHKRNFSG